ncbi:MAG: hypothetical protein BWY76_00806 [bacterium ADurb.Bin429]|nr:MAG: hypothetical protein BWY76_00806 [bacterium ADurb.Bin429]
MRVIEQRCIAQQRTDLRGQAYQRIKGGGVALADQVGADGIDRARPRGQPRHLRIVRRYCRPDFAHEPFIDATTTGNLAVAPLPPLRIVEQQLHRPPLVGITAAQTMPGIRPHRVEDGVAPGAGVNRGRDRRLPELNCGIDAVKAVREPECLSVAEDDDGWEDGTALHGGRILIDHKRGNGDARLRPAVESQSVERHRPHGSDALPAADGLHVLHRGVRILCIHGGMLLRSHPPVLAAAYAGADYLISRYGILWRKLARRSTGWTGWVA